MEQLVPILINSLLGGGGGFLGNLVKKNGLGMIGNIIAGVVGGNGLPAILSAVAPTLLGGSGDGGLDIASILTSVVGGGVGSLLGGLVKKA